MSSPISTTFHDPGQLIDADLRLALAQFYPGDPRIGFVPAYRFRMFASSNQKSLLPPVPTFGHIELRLGDNDFLRLYAGQIAYGVEPEYRGHHYAARSLRLILPLAKTHNFTELWITANPDNWPSRRTCEWAGAELIETVDLPTDCEMYNLGERQKCRYRIAL